MEEFTDAAPAIEGYETCHLLGRGGQAAVWLVRRGDGSEYAAKVRQAMDPGVQQEISVLQTVSHEHLLPLVETVSLADGSIALIFPLAHGGSLAATLVRRGHLTIGELVTVLCPIARALHDVHALGFVHADISPGNILLTAEGKPMLSDIGASRLAGQLHDNSWVTESWAAPEVLGGDIPSPSADVYSLGAIAWAAVTGSAPEPAALRERLEDLAPHLEQPLADLINSCMSFTPAARPSPADFAARLWACAPAEPAPRAGLGHAVAADESVDTAMELTRRIRAAARQDPPATTAIPAKSRKAPTRWAGVAAIAGFAVTLSGGAVWALHRATPTAANGAAAQVTRSAEAPATPSAVRATTPSATPSHPSSLVPPPPARLDPVAVVQGLVDQRAAAWMSPNHGELSAAVVPNSVAWQRDSADLARADSESVRYRNLRFVVKSAAVVRADDTSTIVRAQLQRSEYEVVTSGQAEQRPRDRSVPTNLTLQKVDGAWRLSDWSSTES